MTTETNTKITVEVSPRVAELLAVLDPSGKGDVEAVVARLVDHAQQGVYRVGTWQRGYLVTVFGESWLRRMEPDPDQLERRERPILTGKARFEADLRRFVAGRQSHIDWGEATPSQVAEHMASVIWDDGDDAVEKLRLAWESDYCWSLDDDYVIAYDLFWSHLRGAVQVLRGEVDWDEEKSQGEV
jgi:hypothetical protein